MQEELRKLTFLAQKSGGDFSVIPKDDTRFRHYAAILENPIKAFFNPASAKQGKLLGMYELQNPKFEK